MTEACEVSSPAKTVDTVTCEEVKCWMSRRRALVARRKGGRRGGGAVGVDGLDGGEDGAAPRAVMLVEPDQKDQHDALLGVRVQGVGRV